MTHRFLLIVVSLAVIILPHTIAAIENDRIQPSAVKVASLGFIIDGKTQEAALRREMKITEGMIFDTRDSFMDFLDRDIQELKNLRVFSSIVPEVTFTDQENGTDIQAHISVTVSDTWSLFPFIAPSSEGSGTVLTLAIVDKNFLGSLTELSLSGEIGIGTEPATGDLEIPRWGLYLNWSGIVVNQWLFSTRIVQEYVTERKFTNDTLVEDFSYYNTQMFVDIRYEFRFLRNLYFHIIPTAGANYSYDIRVDSGMIDFEYFLAGLGYALDYQRVDWDGFYRKGWSLGLFNTLWTADDGLSAQFKTGVIGRFSGYGIIGPVNPNTRLVGYYTFNNERTGLAEYLRGVPDNVMYGDWAVFLNNGIQIRLYRGSWLEPHLQPFVDVGIGAERDKTFNWSEDIHVGIGSELLLFFPTLPSVQVRGFIGFDATVPDWSSSSKWEAGLSFDLFY